MIFKVSCEYDRGACYYYESLTCLGVVESSGLVPRRRTYHFTGSKSRRADRHRESSRLRAGRRLRQEHAAGRRGGGCRVPGRAWPQSAVTSGPVLVTNITNFPPVRPMNRALPRRPHGYLARPDAPAMVAVHPVLHDSRVPTHTSVAASTRQGTPRRTADLCCPVMPTSLKECTALLRLSRYPLMPMALSCLMHGHHGP